MAYQNNDEYSAPLSAVGISEDMYANAYDYTVAMGKDKNGVLKGASWQAGGGPANGYRAEIWLENNPRRKLLRKICRHRSAAG